MLCDPSDPTKDADSGNDCFHTEFSSNAFRAITAFCFIFLAATQAAYGLKVNLVILYLFLYLHHVSLFWSHLCISLEFQLVFVFMFVFMFVFVLILIPVLKSPIHPNRNASKYNYSWRIWTKSCTTDISFRLLPYWLA